VACGGLAIVGVSRGLLLFQAIDLSLLSIDLLLLRSRALFALLDLMTDQATRHETKTSGGVAFSRHPPLTRCPHSRSTVGGWRAEGQRH
jgi:hypothetical protein